MGTMEWRLRCIMVERAMWELETLGQLYLCNCMGEGISLSGHVSGLSLAISFEARYIRPSTPPSRSHIMLMAWSIVSVPNAIVCAATLLVNVDFRFIFRVGFVYYLLMQQGEIREFRGLSEMDCCIGYLVRTSDQSAHFKRGVGDGNFC